MQSKFSNNSYLACSSSSNGSVIVDRRALRHLGRCVRRPAGTARLLATRRCDQRGREERGGYFERVLGEEERGDPREESSARSRRLRRRHEAEAASRGEWHRNEAHHRR